MAANTVLVALFDDEDEDIDEVVRCQPIGDDRYLVVDIPTFHRDIGFSDIVTIVPCDHPHAKYRAAALLTNNGWVSYGITFSHEQRPQAIKALEALQAKGCAIQVRLKSYAYIAIPADRQEAVIPEIEQLHRDAVCCVYKLRGPSISATA